MLGDCQFVDIGYLCWCGDGIDDLGVMWMGVIEFLFVLVQDMIFVVILVVGFVMVFNVFVWVLCWCVLFGVIGYGF